MSKSVMMKNMENSYSDISEQKRVLRGILLAERGKLDQKLAYSRSMRICERIQALPEFEAASVVYGYIPVRGEVDVTPLLETCFKQGKRLALPRCLDTLGHMAFFDIQSFSDLVPGAFHIPEPREGLEPLGVTEGLMLVPGVGFDRTCGRLGYGGGYYDRYISAALDVSYIAPAYAFQIVDLLPVEAHDARVNLIVTEEQIIERSMNND